jgi:hypothetical protein
MPSERLNWRYLLLLQRKRSADLVSLDGYRVALDKLERNTEGRLPLRLADRWLFNFAHVARCLLQNLILRPQKMLYSYEYEGDQDVFRIEGYIGRLCGLLREREGYNRTIRSIINTDWSAIAGPHWNDSVRR